MYLLVDIGGTNIVTSLCTTEGILLGSPMKSPTMSHLPAQDLLDYFSAVFTTRMQGFTEQVTHILVGIPSKLIDGCFLPCDNLPSLANIALGMELEKRLRKPCFLAPDALCFASGINADEKQQKQNILCITLGTGLGMALLLNGKPYEGTGLSGEVWKLPYQDKNLEDFVSTRAIIEAYQKKTQLCLEVKQIAENAYNGDSLAIAVFHDFGTALGIFLSYCVSIIDPDIIYIGGGISACNCLYNDYLRQSLAQHTLRSDTPIKYCNAVDETPLKGVYHLFISAKKELT